MVKPAPLRASSPLAGSPGEQRMTLLLGSCTMTVTPSPLAQAPGFPAARLLRTHLPSGVPALLVALLLGSIPGVAVGSLLSTRSPDHILRPALAAVLLASGIKLLS